MSSASVAASTSSTMSTTIVADNHSPPPSSSSAVPSEMMSLGQQLPPSPSGSSILHPLPHRMHKFASRYTVHLLSLRARSPRPSPIQRLTRRNVVNPQFFPFLLPAIPNLSNTVYRRLCDHPRAFISSPSLTMCPLDVAGTPRTCARPFATQNNVSPRPDTMSIRLCDPTTPYSRRDRHQRGCQALTGETHPNDRA